MHGGVSNFLPHACCRKGWHDDRGEVEESHTTAKLIPHLLLSFARTAAKPRVTLNERIDCKKDDTSSTLVPLPL